MNPEDVELIYELSPMQQAMLFHSLYAPGSGVYVLQLNLRLTGRLNLTAFERAWQYVADRHDILRTAFFWEGLEKPVQVVYRQARLEVKRESWRGLDPGEQQARLERFLEADRERGFDFAVAPLMRVSLLELGADVDQMVWQVVWTQHHLVVDGWSQGQVLRELFAAYAAFAAGREPGLPPVRGYREHIAWLQRQDLGQAESFWRKTLAGFDAPTWIAGGDGKAEGPTAQRDLTLSAATSAALRETARRRALTLNTLVQGAWALFLARETGAADVVFGATVAGRPPGLPGVESIVGPFINTLPLRMEVRPGRRLREWLSDLQERQVEMRRFEHSPLVSVQTWSALPAGVALFDHILVFENQALAGGSSSEGAAEPVPGLTVAMESGSSITNYALNVIVLPGEELTVTLRYDTSRFTAAAAVRILARLERLLTALAADEDLLLEDVPQLSEGERHQVVVEWGTGGRAMGEGSGVRSPGDTLHTRFEQQARRTPDAPAVTYAGTSLTYGDLNRRANRLAWHLRSLVGPEDRVGLCGERSLELLEGILGILKAGAAYVPLDPRYPIERLAFLVEDAGVRVVVGTAESMAGLAGLETVEPVLLDVLRPRLESLPGEDPPAAVDGSSLAYVIYTSGSTGRPKGVQVTHGNVVRLFDATRDWFGFEAHDAWTLFHSYAFDFSVWEIWGALLYGGRLVVVPWEVSRSPERFLELLAAEKVTVLNQTPPAFAQLARLDAENGGPSRVPASLRLVIFGGEALDVGSLAPWLSRHGDAHPRLVNMYGITETTVHVTYRPLRASDAADTGGRRSVIGVRIPDLGLYVLDQGLRPAPIGVAGELVVGGAGLARGYLGRPELTAERFVPDAWSGRPGARLYRSGDLGRFLPDGDLEYLGRIDHQVKIRGFRIELGEIEAVLASHPGVRESVVVARQETGSPDDVRLVAYLVAAEAGAEPAPEALRAHLRASLPDHMVPAAFVWLPALPLTQNGKVDRKALPAPEGLRAAEGDYAAPADPVEERLAEIWSEVLRVDRVGAHHDFFALGGHSLLATQVASRLREAFGLEIPLRGLFEAPTVAGLAEVIDEQAEQVAATIDLTALLDDLDRLSDGEALARLEDPRVLRSMAQAHSTAPVQQETPEEELPEVPAAPVALPRQAGDNAFLLSFAQQRLWFIDQLEPDSPAYNVPLPVRLRGELPVARLARIAAELVRRHETLRTTFTASDGQPAQVVHSVLDPILCPQMALVDLSGLPEAAGEETARRIVQADALQPFDLRRGPLLRLRLLRLAPRDHILLLTLHHIISDGWSMRVLLREVAALFAGGRLPELPFQYADFALWQRMWLPGRVLEEQLAFWKRQLADAPAVLELPTDRPRPPVQSSRGAAVHRPLEPEVAAAVRELCRREDVTPFMALLAAWGLLLGRQAGQGEILVGTPVAGRHVRGTEHLIGFFANTLVLRLDLRAAGDLGFRALLAQARRTALDAFAHQDVPFERLVEELVPARDLSRSPLFQTMFVLHNLAGAGGEGWRIPGLAIDPVPLDGGTAKFDILLTMAETADGGFACTLEYSTDLFAADRMARFLENFSVLLAGAAAEPERPLAELPLLTADERRRLLSAWSSNAAEPPPVCVHVPVEEQAERTPDALAVVWAEAGGEEVTYRELNRRANQLAHHLRALGAGPDERVALCLERSPEMLVAVLAVLKAGGAYVPVDPAYPADRVAFMLSDSRSRVLVTTSGVAPALPELGVPAVLLDADREAIAARSGENPELWTIPGNLAYVIYTSGSTGWPKGVAMPHGAAAHFLAWERGDVAAVPGSRTLQFASLSFDVSFQEIFTTWWTGGTLVGIAEETRRDAMALCGVLDAWGVARLFVPFVALQQLAEAIELGAPPPAALREVITAGEQLRITRPIAAWMDRSDISLENHYGPSEGHVLTMHRLTWPSNSWPALPPVGRPLPNLRLVLLDRSFAPVPQGAAGHLFFGGPQVVRGYLDRPELTAETFVPDPFSAQPGGRLYATGDQLRYLEGVEDGTLQFVGRIDQQVKIRGFRVEPGEVEAVLSRHPAVRAAAVVVRGEGAEKALAGYYVADVPLAAVDLSAFLKAELPEHMVPPFLVRLDALPLTPSGKVDRKALPEPRSTVEEGQSDPIGPSDPVEEILAGIWAEVLRRGRVGVHQDFFSLGGHSLLATQVASRIRGTLGVDLPLRQLFETPTVAGFARALRAARQAGAPAAPPIVPVPRDVPGGLPLSFAQQRLWLIDQLEPGSPAYNLPFALRLTGEVSPELLERIFAEVVRRHEVLRTRIVLHEGRPVQAIDGAGRPELRLLDLSRFREREREARAQAAAGEEARRPFDLRHGPLLRLTLVRLGAEDHVLLLTMHHIVADGWSMGVLLREIAALHTAFSADRPSPLPELAVQYADFAVWQRSWMQGEALEAQLAFWKARLEGAPRVLELPTDRPRPARQTSHGAASPLALPSTLAEAVRTLCRRQGATPFMALLAAWGLLLGRHASPAGQNDGEAVLVGTPIAGRNRQETEDLIGFFVNTLVLRVDLHGGSFSGLLRRVRAMALDAYAHQDLPFERLVEELVPERDLSRSPLFQALFVLQNAPAVALQLPGLALAPVEVESHIAKFDLTLAMMETADGLAGSLEHNTDLFDASTAARLVARFAALLEAAAADPDRDLLDLPLLLPAERHQALVEWNDAASAYPREAGLAELFAAVAGDLPDAPAIFGEAGEVWSYRELDLASDRLARRLGSLRGETAVGISMERSPELIVGILAIVKAGGAYVPLDPGYPAERLDFMLADSGAEIVLVHERTRERLAGRARLVEVEDKKDGKDLRDCKDQKDGKDERDDRDGWERVPAESLAYVIYTSGSTGRPKGVAVPQRAVVRLVRESNFVRLGPGDRTGHVANVSFDAATYEIWGALLTGAAVVVVPREVVLSPEAFAAAIRERGITSMFLTSALFTKMAREVPGAFATMKELLVGGEAVDPAAARAVLAGRPPRRLLNGYGPTESTTFAAWHPIREVPPGAVTVPIGLPLANTSLYVLDRAQAPVPPGVAGELCIGGDGLARGYLNRPELTAERFVPDPFGARGERLYRTGDLVRQRPDGAIESLGRLDDQVKVRGFRIEPGEIEAVLSDHPQVKECAVTVSRRAGDTRLVAYVVPVAGSEITESSLREDLKKTLPDYMLPSAMVFLDALPLTPNGKLDRRALPEPEEAARPAVGFVAPGDELELLLARIWEELLDVRRPVGAGDDFFALGGHSLVGTQVTSRIREALGVDLPLRQLFENPTVAGLARAVRAARAEREKEPEALAAPPLVPVVPVPRTGGLPLSFAQQRLWFLDQLEPGSPVYNVPLAVRLTGDLSAGVLERTFHEVVRRHESLRTTFTTQAGQPVQVIAPPDSTLARPEMLVLDLADAPDEERARWARELARKEAGRPFHLQRGPLLRLVLLRLGEREHLLLVTLHHIVADGWSIGVLLREIAALYGAFAQGEPSPLPELPLQYADFALWQRSWLQGAVLDRQLAFWRDRLAGAPRLLEMPADHPRPAVQTFRGASVGRALPAALSGAVQELCQREGVTPFMALLAAWAVLLGRHAGQEDVLIGAPIAGRNRREIEELIGFFVNTLVLRVDLQGGPSFAALLAQVRETALGAFAHQDLPFERIVEEMVPERHLSHSPLFQAAFSLQSAPGQGLSVPGLSLSLEEVDSQIAKFDLSLVLWETPEGFASELEHNTGLFDGGTAERLLARFAALLQAAVRDPGRPVGALPVLLAAERQQVIVEWNDARSAYPREACIAELFAAVAQGAPDAPALVMSGGGEAWSYRRLDEATNRLARRLQRLGVGPETAVGIAMERSVELIVGILAILKAGGVYVPLDAGYPDERREFMLADTGAELVLVHARTRDRLAGHGRLVPVDPEDWREEDGGPVELRVPAESLGVVIYTSGSTGRPKGVALPQRGIVRLVRATSFLRLGPADRMAHLSNISFDGATLEIWGALLNGAALVVIPREVALSPADLAACLRREQVTTLVLTTALFNQVVREAPGALAPLHTVIFGGEGADAAAVAQALGTGAPERLLNVYGPAESTTAATWHLVREVLPGAVAVPIGLPVSNTSVHVLDRWLTPVPPGVVGELCVGGDGLARGYLNRPRQTAERFVPDPWSPGERLYRTGDLVRQRPGGALEFVGRGDGQVKIRGFRIELGEIEAALAGHPSVRECAVVVRDAHLVAYVAGPPGAPPEPGALRVSLSERLPNYMVPSAFVVLAALPLTPNGKLDRDALPEPVRGGGEGYVEPTDPIEILLAGIWADVLEIDRAGSRDNFFALGGHSMLAAQVASTIRGLLHVDLPLRAMFEAASLAELAQAVREARGEAPAVPVTGGEKEEEQRDQKDARDQRDAKDEGEAADGEEGTAGEPPRRSSRREITMRLAGLSPEKRQLLDAVLREQRAETTPTGIIPPREDASAPVPLSFSQERMWFLHQLDPASAVYNIFLGVRLEGELRPEILAAALAELSRRHQILATRYELAGARPVQVIDAGGPFRLPRIDLSGLAADRRAAELGRLQTVESGIPFDLIHGPVLRASLVIQDTRQAAGEHALLLTVHHIAMDGWSLGVLLPDLAALYTALAAGEPLPPAPRLQYADFAVWQRRWLRGEALEAQLGYWRRQLEPPLPVLALPTDRPRSSRGGQAFRLATESLPFPADLTADLHALGNGRGASLFMVLLTGLAAVLQRSGGDERILIGTPVAGRNRRELEDLVGFFLNTLVLRVDLAGDPGFGGLLQSTAHTALEAFAHQDLPLETLLQELRIERGARGPFQVMLLLQNLQPLRVEAPGLTLTGLATERRVDLGTSVFELGLTVEEHAGRLQAAMSYNAALFEAATIRRLLGHLQALLSGAVADPGLRLSSLPLLSPEEQREVLTWNAAAEKVPAGAILPVSEAFAEQAARTPAAEAVRHGDRSLSYGELELRSRAIAEQLAALGAGPDVPVAVFLERSPELIAALLGVLRAGGVYAPLDPALPAERLAWILDDLAPAVLVTEGALAGRLPWEGKTLLLDADGPAPSGRSLPLPTSGQAAYVIYTSGSTGRPKGVVVPHGALSGFVAAARDLYGIDSRDRVLQLASLGFDASVEEIYPCLTTGGALVLRTDEMAATVAGFLQGCAEQGITVLDLPTAFWHELVTSPELEQGGLPPPVRLVILGGERPLPERVAAWLHRTDPRVRLFNTYGPTEATVVATAAELPPALAAEAWREVPIGRPLGGTSAHVLDGGLRPVPAGVLGELFLGGTGIARGYLGRPDLTAEKLLPDPFLGTAGARLYRTGDLARRRPDGSLEFAGRVDAQVKIRGFRVEPGEIESALSASPEVAECAVIAASEREDGPRPGDLRLVAYVVPAPGRKAAAADLRAFLDSRLPAWMVPSAFVSLPALPRTATGKIDRRSLPAPDGNGAAAERAYVAPRNEFEEVIAEIWQEALGLERLSVHDGFFELGGHSLLLLQVMRRLREAFDLEIPLRSIYEERTVEALAQKVEELLLDEIREIGQAPS